MHTHTRSLTSVTKQVLNTYRARVCAAMLNLLNQSLILQCAMRVCWATNNDRRTLSQTRDTANLYAGETRAKRNKMRRRHIGAKQDNLRHLTHFYMVEQEPGQPSAVAMAPEKLVSHISVQSSPGHSSRAERPGEVV